VFFRLNTLKGTAKAPAVELLKLNNPTGTKTYDENPRLYMGDPLPHITLGLMPCCFP